jgi:glycosyltransferase involved in cell wall biosynthesis
MSRQLGAKCVLSVHTPVLQNEGISPSMRYIINTEYALLLKRLAKIVDLNIVVSRFVKRELVTTGVPEEEIRVVPSGLRTEIFQPRPLNGPIGKEMTCLYVGRFARIKGLDTLIRAAKIINGDTDLNARFFLVGGTSGDDDYSRVREMISGMGLQHTVILCPPVPHQKIPETYEQCDCFILPSNREPLGKVVLEAMSSQRPVVASNAGGIPDLVWEGKTGLLFESGSPESLANRLREILSEWEKIKKMTQRSVRFTKRFDWNRISSMYLDAFESALSMEPRGGIDP